MGLGGVRCSKATRIGGANASEPGHRIAVTRRMGLLSARRISANGGSRTLTGRLCRRRWFQPGEALFNGRHFPVCEENQDQRNDGKCGREEKDWDEEDEFGKADVRHTGLLAGSRRGRRRVMWRSSSNDIKLSRERSESMPCDDSTGLHRRHLSTGRAGLFAAATVEDDVQGVHCLFFTIEDLLIGLQGDVVLNLVMNPRLCARDEEEPSLV